MNLISRLSHAWSALTGEAGPLADRKAPAGYYGSGWSGGPSFVDAFRSRRAPSPPELVEQFKSICYACAYLNAHGVARVPLRLYATTGRGQDRPKAYTKAAGRRALDHLARTPSYVKAIGAASEVDEVAEHPLLEALAEVNADFDSNLLLLYTVLSMDITGAAYWLPEEGGLAGIPASLWPLQGQYVIPTRLSNRAPVDYFQYFGDQYKPDQLIRFRHVSMKDPYGPGYGPTQAAFEAVGLGEKFVTTQEQLLNNGIRPSVIISSKDLQSAPGPDERRRYEAEVNGRLAMGGQGKAWFIDGAVNVNSLEFPRADPADLEVNKWMMGRVANAFGVPISLLTTEDVNLANAEAGNRQHAQLAVEPRCIRIASGLTRWTRTLAARRENARLNWDRLFWAFDPAVGEDVERRARVFDMELKSGKRTINEVRAEDGQPPAPWGDEPWLPSTLRQPSEERPEPAAPPGTGADPAEPDTDDEAETKALIAESRDLMTRVKQAFPEIGK